ncbi:MAG: 30S ribosomal protein S3 [Anaerolineaceae bacterium]|nr:30S ribosomal protein S3 [Anaerolineaceae bacterium]
MGRKVHPLGMRLGIIKSWDGRWFAEGQNYIDQLHQDIEIRGVVRKLGDRAGVSQIEIERFPGKVRIIVHTAKPGILIGRKGETVKVLRKSLEDLSGKKIDLEIREIKNPDCDALLISENIASQIERRISYRRAMKRAIQQAIRQGAQGVKIQVAGRLNGAEMCRTIWLREGRVPLQTLRADIDFARSEAATTYGKIGVKTWVYKGEILPGSEEEVQKTEGVYVSE